MKSLCGFPSSHGTKGMHKAENCTVVARQDNVFSLFWPGLLCQSTIRLRPRLRPRCALNVQDQQKDVGVL